MEGKLIKQEDGYYALYNTEGIFISDVNGGSVANRLSNKNCQAIDNGYDLDELIKKEITDGKLHPNDGAKKEGIMRGIQLALKILGDKKFSEEDVKKRVELVKEQFRKDVDTYGKPKKIMSTLDTIHQSLQQTEWDVEIEIEPYHDGDFIDDGKTHIIEAKLRPRLDVDGCLILKRK